MSDADRALIDPTAGASTFDLSGAPNDAGLQLTFKRAPYAANIQINLTRESDELREECRLAIEPTSSPIDRVIVYATSRLEDGAQWVEGGTNSPLSAERLAANDELRANLPKGGDVWLVRLPQPMSRAFEIAVT